MRSDSVSENLKERVLPLYSLALLQRSLELTGILFLAPAGTKHLGRQEAADLSFFDYDAFCADPEGTLERLAQWIGLPQNALRGGERIVAARSYDGIDLPDTTVERQSFELHADLAGRAI